MRKLMVFTLGFGASCVLCVYFLPQSLFLPVMALLTAAMALLALLAPRNPLTRAVTLFLLGGAASILSFSLFHSLYLAPAVEVDGMTATATFRVSDFSETTQIGSGAEGTIQLKGRTYQAKLYLNETSRLTPGMELTGEFRFRTTTAEGQEPATYHQGRGIFLLLYQAGDLETTASELTLWDKIAVLRNQIQSVLDSSFPPDTAPFARALLLGDTSGLTYEEDTALKISGIRHVAAVSGLHVSILFALLSVLTLKNRFLTALVGFPGLLLFAALAGFTPSVTRSCLMLSLTLTALLFEKGYDGPTALSFAVLVMLLCNPLTVTDIGFQLSVASVAGIFAFAGRLQTAFMIPFGEAKGRKRTLLRWISGSVSTTLGATVFTAPLSAIYFGTVSLVGVLTNLLTLWVISLIFYGILAVTLVGAVWSGAGNVLAWLAAWPIRYVLAVAKALSCLPMAAVYTSSLCIVLWLIFVYLLLGWLWLSKKKRPVTALSLSVLGLCAALMASWLLPMTYDSRLTVLDVGQGQCILLQSKGFCVMVDCGGEDQEQTADLAAQTLLSQGITRLDALIVTHTDSDHAGAVEQLLSRISTRLLVLPREGLSLTAGYDGEVVYPDRDMELTFPDGRVQIFAPRFSAASNEMSLCVLFDTVNCDILITGDRSEFGERSLLRNSYVPNVDILIAGHHGAAFSTSQLLLERTDPEVVCISVGRNNSYGHPSYEVLERLSDYGCQVYRTDLHGQITIGR